MLAGPHATAPQHAQGKLVHKTSGAPPPRHSPTMAADAHAHHAHHLNGENEVALATGGALTSTLGAACPPPPPEAARVSTRRKFRRASGGELPAAATASRR